MSYKYVGQDNPTPSMLTDKKGKISETHQTKTHLIEKCYETDENSNKIFCHTL